MPADRYTAAAAPGREFPVDVYMAGDDRTLTLIGAAEYSPGFIAPSSSSTTRASSVGRSRVGKLPRRAQRLLPSRFTGRLDAPLGGRVLLDERGRPVAVVPDVD